MRPLKFTNRTPIYRNNHASRTWDHWSCNGGTTYLVDCLNKAVCSEGRSPKPTPRIESKTPYARRLFSCMLGPCFGVLSMRPYCFGLYVHTYTMHQLWEPLHTQPRSQILARPFIQHKGQTHPCKPMNLTKQGK